MWSYFRIILTGDEIAKEVNKRNIIIDPYYSEQINPNSYNYRINDELIEFNIIDEQKFKKRLKIPKKGIILEPHKTYFASTFETLGSKKYAMLLIGRSSLGRLGLFLQVSANLGHTGSNHKWTLELMATKKIRIYPFMIIGQISFWDNKGNINLYKNGYSDFNFPQISKMEHAK